MSGFVRRGGRLFIEDIALSFIAKQYGTPCYVYSQTMILDAFAALRQHFARVRPRFFYAVKANGNLSILRLLNEAGAGFDIVSGGEMARALAAGATAENIVFSGVGKSEADIKAALSAGIGCFNVESAAEMARIESIAACLKKTAPVAVRVIPDIDGGTHPHLTTGVADSKFGVNADEAMTIARQATASVNLQFCGFACHLGSQICNAQVYIDMARKMRALKEEATAQGIAVYHLDLGGGFAVDYENSSGLDIDLAPYANELARFEDTEIWIEPGRAIIAAAGALLTCVEYTKEINKIPCWVADAGMNDILRPALYAATHAIEAIEDNSKNKRSGMVVGPVCESADILSRRCELSAVAGDVLAVRDAGAYGAVMASNYNARLRPCEVLVCGDKSKIIRNRETLKDMLADEKALL